VIEGLRRWGVGSLAKANRAFVMREQAAARRARRCAQSMRGMVLEGRPARLGLADFPHAPPQTHRVRSAQSPERQQAQSR
jgi:hypothetical protein